MPKLAMLYFSELKATQAMWLVYASVLYNHNVVAWLNNYWKACLAKTAADSKNITKMDPGAGKFFLIIDLQAKSG